MVDTAPGRNEPCHCGSGKKYKQCCLVKDEAAARKARAKAAGKAPAPSEGEAPVTRPPKHATEQPWKRSAINTRGFHRARMPRKVGGS
jgi:hypothetical protein